MSSHPAAAMAAPAQAIDLGLAYRTLTAEATAAPYHLVQLCARVLADRRSCSDAVLLVADAIREMADDAANPACRSRYHLAFTPSQPELLGLRSLADAMAAQAPGRAGTCAP